MMLGIGTLNLRRTSAVTWAAGRATATTADTTFSGSWQPLNGREIAMLPEGERASDRAKVYTATVLRTVDQHSDTEADLVSRDGSTWYKCLIAKPYFDNTPIPHYRIEVVRVQEQDS